MSGYLFPANQTRVSFITNLLRFVRSRIINHEDCAIIVREARKYFCLQLSYKLFDELFSEVIFSLFEVVPCGEQCVVVEELHYYMNQKLTAIFFNADNRLRRDWLDTTSFSIQFRYSQFIMLRFEVAQRLVRYGVRFEFSSLQLPEMLRKFRNEIMPWFFGEDGDELNERALRSVYMTPDSKIRLCVVLWVLYISQRVKRFNYITAVRDSLWSLNLVFRTIRQPLVTVKEVLRFFEVSIGRSENCLTIQEIIMYIKEYFPKSVGFLAPRSLKHLSRCEVRKCMGIARSLPKGVSSLGIPVTIQNYLLIQRRREEHFPGYVTALETRYNLRPLHQNSISKRVKV